MTSQDASQQLNACESQIADTYLKLRGAAIRMGSSATKAASSKTTSNTLLPLIISLVGFIFCFAAPFWGVVLIIGGIVIAYKTHQSAASVRKNIETQVKYLNSTLDSNSRI